MVSDAQRIANLVEPYVYHKPDCTYDSSLFASPGSEHCNCGLKQAAEDVQAILERQDVE